MTDLATPHAQPSPPRHACWSAACLLLGLYVAVLAVAAATLPAAERGLVVFLLAAECVAIATVVPFLAARSREGDRRAARAMCVLLPTLGLAVASLVIVGVVGRGAAALTTIAWAQLFLLAFALALAGLVALLASLGIGPTTAQLVASLVGLAMVGNVFFANSLVEAPKSEEAKTFAIDATLWTNPWLIVGGTVLEADPLRNEAIYSFSVIIFYGFRYPAASAGGVGVRALSVATPYAACGLGLHALGWLVAWIRRRSRPGGG